MWPEPVGTSRKRRRSLVMFSERPEMCSRAAVPILLHLELLL